MGTSGRDTEDGPPSLRGSRGGPALDLDFVRSRFPALDRGWIFLDNGGGSQIVQPVLDRINDFLVSSNVQLGASYEPSRIAGRRLERAQAAVATLLNAEDPAEVVMGPSTTSLLRTLAHSLERVLEPGDEIVVTECDHEANISPWLALERAGARIRWWRVHPETGELDADALHELLGSRTRLVAMTHASNILGRVNHVRTVADTVHGYGAWLCVDGVGFAPHRAVDVRALGVDFYALSFYKTFGPHHAVLWGRKEHLFDLPGHGFYFISEDDVPYKFQPGNVNYELSYATLGLLDYLSAVAGKTGLRGREMTERASVEVAFDAIARHEERMARRLLDFLCSREGVDVVGPEVADHSVRVPIISFVTEGRGSREIVEAVDRHRIGIRFGHFYSPRLLDALGLTDDDGVIRVSMAHYNTVEEIDRLVEVLDVLL